MKKPLAKRSRSAGCLTLVIIIVVILVLDQPVSTILDWPFNPWAHAWRGEPTLVGIWVGTVTSPSGQQRGLLLELRRSRNSGGDYSSCAGCPRIDGTARLCGGGEQRYDLWGGPDTWSGAQFHLNDQAAEPQMPELQLGYMKGEWAGDELRLAMTFKAGADTAAAGASDDRDVRVPVQFTLERGDEQDFLAACRKLGATGPRCNLRCAGSVDSEAFAQLGPEGTPASRMNT